MAEVFISYSRKDKEFVRKLGASFNGAKREAWLDWKDIPLTAEWQQEIFSNIEAADNFLFIISSDSVASPNCKREIDCAVANNKRMLPIYYRPVPDAAVPENLGKFQRIDFERDDQFDEQFAALIKALDTDLPWVQAHTRLLTRAKEWEREKKDGSFLLRGKDLGEAEQWIAGSGDREPRITTLQSQYTLASRQAAIRLQRLVMGAVVIALAVAVGLAVFAFHQKNVAQQNARESKVRELTAIAAQDINEDPERSILLSMYAVDATLRFGEAVVPAAEDELHNAILSSQVRLTLRGHSGIVYAVAYSGDGSRLVTVGENGEAKVWDAHSGKHLLNLTEQSKTSFYSAAFNSDGSRLTTVDDNGEAKLWDASSGRQLLAWNINRCFCAAISQNAARLAVRVDYMIGVWDASNGKLMLGLRERSGKPFVAVAFNRDGTRLVGIASNGEAMLWDADSGRELLVWDTHAGENPVVAINRDGTRVASTNRNTVTIWETVHGKEVRTLSAQTGTVYSVAFSSDGSRLAAGSRDGAAAGSARVWDTASGEELLTLRGHTAAVLGVAFGPDGALLATASEDQTAKLWDTLGGHEALILPGRSDSDHSVAFSPDGVRLASADGDSIAELWNVVSGTRLPALNDAAANPSVSGQAVDTVAWAGDGARLATASANGTVKVWDTVTRMRVPGDWDRMPAYGVALSGDGARLVTNNMDATLWDVTTGKELRRFPGKSAFKDGVAISRDGKRLATLAEKGQVVVWDVDRGAKLRTLREPAEKQFNGIAFSRDGARLAAVGDTAVLWDLGSGKELVNRGAQPGQLYSVAVNPDGTLVATVGWDKTVEVWSAVGGQVFLTLRDQSGPDGMIGVTFSPDGERLAVAWGDGTVKIYFVHLQDLLHLAHQRLTRMLTPDECMRYLQTSTCPPLP